MGRPTFVYDGNADNIIYVGCKAIIKPFTGPTPDGVYTMGLSKTHIATAPVLNYDMESGDFETEDAFYIREYGD